MLHCDEWFSSIQTYYHRWLPLTAKWWNYSPRWPPLGSEIIQLSSSSCRRVFLMLETVCGNHCSMGWPWDGRYRIISSTPMRWDGAHLNSAGVLKHSLLCQCETPPTTWYLVVQSDLTSRQHNIVVAPNTISGFFQAPAATVKTLLPEYLSDCS